MNILIFNSFYLPYVKGGAEVIVKLIAEGLVSQGHTVTVVSTVDSPNREVNIINGVTSVQIQIPNLYWPYAKTVGPLKKLLWHFIDNWNPFARFRVKSLIQKYSPDLVVTHNLAGFSSSVWGSSNSLNIPVVHVVHDYYLMCPKSSMFSKNVVCEKQCFACKVSRIGMKGRTTNVSKAVFVSDFLKKKFLNDGYFKSIPTQIIHNSIETKDVQLYESNSPNFVVGYIGRVTFEKGIETLLEAFQKIRADTRYSNISLKVAGEVDELYLQTLLTKFGVSADFLGKVNPNEFYSKISLCVIPSLWNEPFGLVAVEALNAGVPVIASDSGGLNEIVIDGVNGLIFPKGRVDELVKKICQLYDDDALLHFLSSQSKKSVSNLTNLSDFVTNHQKAYNSVVHKACKKHL